MAVDVQGFVVTNDALRVVPVGVHLRAAQNSATSRWCEVEVETEDGHLYPFWFPQSLAAELERYIMVRVKGFWVRHEDDWHLLPTMLVRRHYPHGHEWVEHVADLQPPLTCSYCGRRIRSGIGWGFDPGHSVECERCSRSRGELTPRQFLDLCRKIVANRERSR